MPDPPVSVDLGATLLAVDDALRGTDVGYAFGGAIALAYHVRQPRGTVDIDVNVATAAATVGPLLDALPGVDWDEATLTRLEDEGWVRLWLPGDIALDVFVPQHAFHADLQAHAELVPFKGRPIPIVSATHLTVLKTMFGRSKDWVDIEAMLDAEAVDADEAVRWVEELLGADHPSARRLGELVSSSR